MKMRKNRQRLIVDVLNIHVDEVIAIPPLLNALHIEPYMKHY